MNNEFGKWEVRLRQPEERIGVDVVIYRHVSNGTQVINFNEKGDGIITTLKRGEALPAPTMRLDYEAKEILNALMAAGDEFGVKRPEESFTAGKLTATEKHLEDMRQLVFGAEQTVSGVSEPTWKGKPISQLTPEDRAEFYSQAGSTHG